MKTKEKIYRVLTVLRVFVWVPFPRNDSMVEEYDDNFW